MKRNYNLSFYLVLATLLLLLISGCTLQNGENSADQSLVNGIAKSTSLVEYITPGSLGSDYLEGIIEDPGFHMYEFYTVMDKLISKTYYISVESESTDSNRMRILKVNTDGTLGSMNGLSFGQKKDSHLKFVYHRGTTFMVLYNSTNGSLTVTAMKTNGLPRRTGFITGAHTVFCPFDHWHLFIGLYVLRTVACVGGFSEIDKKNYNLL